MKNQLISGAADVIPEGELSDEEVRAVLAYIKNHRKSREVLGTSVELLARSQRVNGASLVFAAIRHRKIVPAEYVGRTPRHAEGARLTA